MLCEYHPRATGTVFISAECNYDGDLKKPNLTLRI